MRYNVDKLQRIRLRLRQALKLLSDPAQLGSGNGASTGEIDRATFERAEDIIGEAFAICQREVGDGDFNDGIGDDGR